MTRQASTGSAELAGVAVEIGLDFEAWYRREYRAVLALAVGLTGSLVAAEDITHDGFTDAHRRWDELGGHPNPNAWIRRVVMNKAASRIRRLTTQRRYQHLLIASEESTAWVPGREVWELVRRLPKRQGQVVVLHYLEDLPVIDIAEILDLSPGTVKTHLHRARQTLRRQIEEVDHGA